MDERAFHTGDGLRFTRGHDGSVTIAKHNEQGELLFEQTVPPFTWVSAVLTMSAFDERPGDWDAWLRHHMGEEDILRPAQPKNASTEVDCL